jgi:hypothetical protein
MSIAGMTTGHGHISQIAIQAAIGCCERAGGLERFGQFAESLA